MTFICDHLVDVQNMTMQLVGIVSVVTALIIILSRMVGDATHNPKLSVWSKTEIIQLVISVGSAAFIWLGITSMCSLYIDDLGAMFGSTTVGHMTVFDAAQKYFLESGDFIKTTMRGARYHLSAYNIFQMHSLWKCDSGSKAANILMCIFGGVLGLGGGTGISVAPDRGFSFASAAIGGAFNSVIFTYLSLLNYFFILEFIYFGFVLFFLPFGIFLRSMPFMRGFGSLLIAVAISFLFVYPTILALFYLDLSSTASALKPTPSPKFIVYANNEQNLYDIGGWRVDDSLVDNAYYDDSDGDRLGNTDFEVLKLTGYSFILGVFIPTFALLATIGSIGYLNRFLGQEIDLSKIVQMV